MDEPVTVIETFRDRLRKLSPTWLQIGLAEKIMYSVGVHLDAFGDALVAGVQMRFPGYYDMQSLSLLGRERRIPRGRAESDSSYAARLGRFLTDHPYRGGPYALLAQLSHYFAPVVFEIDLVYANGPRFTLNTMDWLPWDERIQRGFVEWTPGDPAQWARWWLFYNVDIWAVTPPTDAELQELRFIPRQWNAAHCLGTVVLFPSGAELWNWPPGHTWNETGTWDTDAVPIYIEVDPS